MPRRVGRRTAAPSHHVRYFHLNYDGYFPDAAPSRLAYLSIRWLSVLAAAVLVALAVVAKLVINREQWMTPILSPSLTSLCGSLIDAVVIHIFNQRYPRRQRLWHDGAIFIGYAVAIGFLISFSIGDIRSTADGGNSVQAAVAEASLFFMFIDMSVSSIPVATTPASKNS
jgi:hypothetical protein